MIGQFEMTSDNRGSDSIGLKGKDTTARSGSQVDVYAAKAKKGHRRISWNQVWPRDEDFGVTVEGNDLH
jgi:hypothetical protein